MITSPSSTWRPSPLAVAAVLAIICSLAVATVRIHTSWHAAGLAPGTAETSGCEEESWLSLWNRLHDRPALRPVTAAPFNYAYFNWAFYESYSGVVSWFGGAEDPVRLVRFGRLFSTFWALTGLVVLANLLHTVGGTTLSWPLAAFWSALATAGPLTGWFITTVRPDVAAITFEILGLLFAWRSVRRPGEAHHGFVALASLSVYAAWAFKPSFIGVMSGIGLFYLLARRWQPLAVYCSLVWGCTALTFALGGETYREVIVATIFQLSRFDLATGLAAGWHALMATSPLWTAIVVLLLGWRNRSDRSDETVCAPSNIAANLALCCLATTLPLSVLAAFKVGAWSYYYLPVLPAASLLVVAWSACRQVASLATAVAACMTLILQAGLLTGAWGSVSREAAAEELAQRWNEFSALPEPRFSDDLRLNLPWLNPASPAFVLAYDYAALRKAGVEFEAGGLGGMIGRGELAALYLRPPAPSHFDGATLEEFARFDYPSGFSGFIRPKLRATDTNPHQLSEDSSL